MILYYFFIFIFGLIIGSFLNAVIYRLDKKRSIFQGRSRCPKCKKLILWYDNIPIISFFLLRGRCRHCQKKISWQYPLVEFFTGLIFLINSLVITNFNYLSFYNWPVILQLSAAWIISSLLIIIFVYDLKYYLILDRLVIPLAILAFLYNLLNYSLINLLIGGIIGLSFFLIQFLISQGKWIGDGDLRLGLAMGFILGFPKIFLGLFLAYFIGSIVAVILLATTKKSFKSRIPFGPFLVVGTYLTMLFGDLIINKYFYF